MSLFRPFCLKKAVTWLSFQYLENSIKKLLNNFDSEKDMGVDINEKKITWNPTKKDKYDCLRPLMIFSISNGEMLIISNDGICSFFSRCGISSSEFLTVDFKEKVLFNNSAF